MNNYVLLSSILAKSELDKLMVSCTTAIHKQKEIIIVIILKSPNQPFDGSATRFSAFSHPCFSFETRGWRQIPEKHIYNNQWHWWGQALNKHCSQLSVCKKNQQIICYLCFKVWPTLIPTAYVLFQCTSTHRPLFKGCWQMCSPSKWCRSHEQGQNSLTQTGTPFLWLTVWQTSALISSSYISADTSPRVMLLWKRTKRLWTDAVCKRHTFTTLPHISSQ